MMRRANLPLAVSALPQQRLVEVVDLPPLPEGLRPTICFNELPEGIAPKRRPSRMTYLGTIEWAWHPHSSRIDAYYVHRSRQHWLLYLQDPFPNEPEWQWQVAAIVPLCNLTLAQASSWLVLARWGEEALERGLDHFHWVSEEGAMSVAEWKAIGRATWPQEVQGPFNTRQDEKKEKPE